MCFPCKSSAIPSNTAMSRRAVGNAPCASARSAVTSHSTLAVRCLKMAVSRLTIALYWPQLICYARILLLLCALPLCHLAPATFAALYMYVTYRSLCPTAVMAPVVPISHNHTHSPVTYAAASIPASAAVDMRHAACCPHHGYLCTDWLCWLFPSPTVLLPISFAS